MTGSTLDIHISANYLNPHGYCGYYPQIGNEPILKIILGK
jgi:hypothetical protein